MTAVASVVFFPLWVGAGEVREAGVHGKAVLGEVTLVGGGISGDPIPCAVLPAW